MADLEQARRAVLARFRGRMSRLAALLPEAAPAAEGAALQAEQTDQVPASMRERRARPAASGREPRRRTG